MSSMDKLLIVDDQEQEVKKYSRLFKADFECITALSGESALALFHEETPEFVLSDVKMPGGMSGFELCQQIKSESPKTIVVLVSSYNNTAYRIRGYESRADEYLDRNTSDQEVYLKVRNLLYTKNNIPATFTTSKTTELSNTNSFESDVKAMIIDYYQTPLHCRTKQKLDLEAVSKKLHKSVRTVQREFVKEVGCTFSDFHNNMRLRIAAELLISSEQSIKEIAETLNFSSPSSFSKSFRLVHNVTPSKYRYNYLQED